MPVQNAFEKYSVLKHPESHVSMLSVQTNCTSSLELGKNSFRKLLSLLLLVVEFVTLTSELFGMYCCCRWDSFPAGL